MKKLLTLIAALALTTMFSHANTTMEAVQAETEQSAATMVEDAEKAVPSQTDEDKNETQKEETAPTQE